MIRQLAAPQPSSVVFAPASCTVVKTIGALNLIVNASKLQPPMEELIACRSLSLLTHCHMTILVTVSAH